MKCPKCEHAMETVRYGAGDREVERCTNCKGIWFKPIDLERLRRTYQAEIIDEGKASTGREFNKKDEIDCPVCGVMMEKESDEEQSHIWYESCPNGHGVFFDAGELRDLSQETFTDIIKGWITGSRT